MEAHRLSHSRSCGLLGLARSTAYYKPVKPDDRVVRDRLKGKGVKSVLDDRWYNVFYKIMSRLLCIEFPGEVYHVMNRGLNRNSIFCENKDYGMLGGNLRAGLPPC
jgi:hypothetical protein